MFYEDGVDCNTESSFCSLVIFSALVGLESEPKMWN